MKHIFSILFLLLSLSDVWAQTANVTEGCKPLTVQFTAPNGLTDHFWDFKDGGASSNLQNPEKIFAEPGVYEVTLNEGASGNQVGTVTITVYPEIELNYSANIPDNCKPRNYEFRIDPVAAPGVSVNSYLWTFDNGLTSSEQNPDFTYGYNDTGNRAITLEVVASPSSCSFSKRLDTVVVERELIANFEVNPKASCTIPMPVTFQTNGAIDSEATYTWDYGDGNTASGPDIKAHQYTEKGVYTASLTVAKGECADTTEFIIYAGAPEATFLFNDTLCINVFTPLTNATPGNPFLWTFEPSVELQTGSSTTDKSPVVKFSEEGWTTIRMVAQIGAMQDCLVDTTFQVYIQDPGLDVVIDPYSTCVSPLQAEVMTTEPFVDYFWNNMPGDRTYTATYEEPERDSFFINIQDTMRVKVRATTPQGCVAQLDTFYFWQYPEAHFYPSVHHGCAPLTVTFIDSSQSAEPIVNHTYDYGNGETQSFNSVESHSYTFDTPGEYYVTLAIENDAGCIDTSWAVLIEVGEPLDMDFTLDQSEICYGESVTITAGTPDPRIDVFNMLTDDGRSHHCEGETALTHSFITDPGLFDIKYTTVYNGCQNNQTVEDAIRVKGPRAKAWYMINCDDPLTVMFADSSKEASRIEWTLEPGVTSDQSSFSHTFPSSGDYTVYLEAFNDATGCPSHKDSIVVHVRQVQAIFDLPEHLCDNVEYKLDASASIDVDSTCFKGYTWSFVHNGRPRRVGVSALKHVFPVVGKDIVTLEVEDINGCTDSISKIIEVFSIQPNFTFDEPICFPVDMTFTDTSNADTTLVAWTWSHGALGENNIIEFGSGSSVSVNFNFFDQDLDELPIYLDVEDAVGCTDQIQFDVDVYRPEVIIESEPGICIGDSVTFVATEIPGSGTGLSYEWNFGNGSTSSESTVTVPYNVSGEYQITLNLTEGASGCQNEQVLPLIVTEYPVAAFTMSSNGNTLGPDDVICFPEFVQFNNNSTLNNNPVSYAWEFTSEVSDSKNSLDSDPKMSLDAGEWLAELVLTSAYGCADTISAPVTVVETKGGLMADKNKICFGEEVTFTLVDTANIASWSIDFGDGNVVSNQSPISYPIGANTSANNVNVILTLQNSGYACEGIDIVPIRVLPIEIDTVEQKTYNVEKSTALSLETGLNGSDSFVWYQSHPGMSCTNCIEPMVNTDTTECLIYGVSTFVATEEACVEERRLYTVNPIPIDIQLPNLFTPNGDNNNDFFNYVELIDPAKGSAVVSVVKFEVYDRWGKKVYDNETPNTGWDGRYNSNNAPAEVYGYYIELELINETVQSYKGDVTLLR